LARENKWREKPIGNMGKPTGNRGMRETEREREQRNEGMRETEREREQGNEGNKGMEE